MSFHFSGVEYFAVSLAFESIYTWKFPAVNAPVSLVCEFLWPTALEFLWTFSTWMCPADVLLNYIYCLKKAARFIVIYLFFTTSTTEDDSVPVPEMP